MIGATEISISLGTEKEEISKEAHGKGDHKSKGDHKLKGGEFFTSRGVTVLPVGGVVPRPRAPSFSQSPSRGTRGTATAGGETTPTKGSTPMRPPTSTPTSASTPTASTVPSAPHVSTPTSPSSQWSPERTGHHLLVNPTHQSNLVQSAASPSAHPSKRLVPPPPPNPTALPTDTEKASEGDQLLLFSDLLSDQWGEMEYFE